MTATKIKLKVTSGPTFRARVRPGLVGPQGPQGEVADANYGDITVSGSGTNWTINSDAVTYAKLQNISASARFLGRITGGAGNAEELTGTQATTLIDAVVGDSGSGGTKGLVPAPGAGDAAAGKFLKADGTFAVPPREVLTDNRTYYVNVSSGSDSNDGLTSGAAFATLQKAVDVVFAGIDLGGYDVTISVAVGTYTSGVSVDAPQVGAGVILLQGDTSTPSNVVVSVTSADCISATNGAIIHARGFSLQTTTSGNCLYAATGGTVKFSDIEFNACAGYHLYAELFGVVQAYSAFAYAITGNSLYHQVATSGGMIYNAFCTITIANARAFTGFAYVNNISVNVSFSISFTGAGVAGTTGTRYSVNGNSVVFTNGGGASYFPGDVAGSTGTGGQYI